MSFTFADLELKYMEPSTKRKFEFELRRAQEFFN